MPMMRLVWNELLCQQKQLLQILSLAQLIDAGPPLAADCHQVGIPQAGKMGADGALGQPEMIGEFPDLVLPGLQVLKDQQPRRVGKGMEEGSLPRLAFTILIFIAFGLYHRHITMIGHCARNLKTE